MIKFTITAGDRPIIKDTITADETDVVVELAAGVAPSVAPVDLTGCTVKLLFQGAGQNYSPSATLLDAVNGRVQYQFGPTETLNAGVYTAAWQVTDAGGVVTTTESFEFEILPAQPVSVPTTFSRLADFYDDIRAITGDFDKSIYEDSAIGSVMKTVLRLGKVQTECTRWKLLPDGVSVSPSITDDDLQAYGLLVYETALRLVAPNSAAYSYRLRAISERFGEQRDFLAELKHQLYDLQDDGVYATVSGLRSSIFAVNGISVWTYLQVSNAIELSFRS